MTEEQIKKFGIKIQNLQPDSTNYSANIIVQCFGKEDEDDKHIVHPLNFMPRKERCCELDYDLSDKGQKEKYLKQLRDSQERLKILSLLLHYLSFLPLYSNPLTLQVLRITHFEYELLYLDSALFFLNQ